MKRVQYTILLLLVFIALAPSQISAQDTVPGIKKEKKTLKLNPMKATMMAAVFPGAGQIYNRKYWKVPFAYAGFAGVGFAVAYNTKWYNNWVKAYQDFNDLVPETNSYLQLIKNPPPQQYDPVLYPGANPSTTAWIKDLMLGQVDYFKRYRDLSYIGIAAWYLVTILDANVDASLSDYNVNENLNLALTPVQVPYYNFTGVGVGLTITINF